MIEQYIFNKITEDTTLQTLLSDGGGGYHIYPNKVNRGVEFERGITFTLVGGVSKYPLVKSIIIQFNIFALIHSELGNISEALANVFDEDNLQTSGGISIVYSQKQTVEFDLETSLDDPNFYQRTVSYYFKIQ